MTNSTASVLLCSCFFYIKWFSYSKFQRIKRTSRTDFQNLIKESKVVSKRLKGYPQPSSMEKAKLTGFHPPFSIFFSFTTDEDDNDNVNPLK